MGNDWSRGDDEEADEITPDDPDWDLSEAHGYVWEPARRDWPVSPAALAVVSIVLIVALVLPGVLLILR
jgi:hypothetical protein